MPKRAPDNDKQDALIDHAYACGMRAALAMAAQGAERTAHELSERLRLDALRVIGGEA